MKSFVFHLNLMRSIWKQLREFPNAEVTVDVHQRIEGQGRLVPVQGKQ
jgi:hypothetical protein